MIGDVISGGVHGIDAHIVRVECDIASGFPAFEIVGSLASEVKESRERVVTALRNSDVVIPNKRITVNLSPANLRKHGTGYDLPVAVSILMAMDIIDIKSVENTLFIGELSLGGEITGVRGVLPVVKKGRDEGISRFIVPKTNAKEAAVIDDVIVICVDNLTELISYLTGALNVERVEPSHYGLSKSAEQDFNDKKILDYDFAKISGQKVAKRGLEIATAGLHNVLMVGPPGTGKTLLAKSLPGILPPMNKDEILEVSSIYSVAGKLPENGSLITKRPVVTAHHTATDVAMSGGGNTPHPGMISLAHRGVLFLDEMPEFPKKVLEVLRQPIEDKVIHVAKNGYSVSYPSDFMLVGAMNPCPCGMYPDMNKCTCTENMRKRYISKLSKPLVDRVDLCMQVSRPESSEILKEINEEPSYKIRERVIKAQKIQQERYKNTGILFNSQMGIDEIKMYCELKGEKLSFMENVINKYDLSARSFHRMLRCARTIADLDESKEIEVKHLTEALFFKCDIYD